jgi:3-hydroxyacyl-[acyl-carrier-protein] dehydratase
LKDTAVHVVWQTVVHEFRADHPTAAGHFPGNPIIPGALLLDHALRAISPSQETHEVRVAKFLLPVRPGDRVTIRWRTLDTSEVAFECRLAATDQAALVGSLTGNAS